jgi:hypothetical protein
MLSRSIFSLALALAILCLSPHTRAQPRPYVLEGTEVHSIPSKILGREYEIYVSLPASYAGSQKKYPVLFLADANYGFPVVRSINRRVSDNGRKLEEFILVALSYGKGDNPTYSRNRDYTPTDVNAKKTREPDQDGEVYGGAEPYRQHVLNEVFPYVAGHFRADMTRKVFAGHSYGALFGVHALFTAPSMFDAYVLSSPSLWYDKHIMFAVERDYAARHPDLPAKVLMMTGSFETVRPGSKDKRYNTRDDMVRDMKNFEKQLKSRHYPNLSIRSLVIPEEDHLSAFPSAITRGLVWAFGKP